MLQTPVRTSSTDSMVSTRPKLIRLDFEDLTAFERLTDRYRHLGVQFVGALALHPSNPAFPPKSGNFVLMPLGYQTVVTAYFDRPTCWVGAWVCGGGSIILTAFDRDGKAIDRTSTTDTSSSASSSHQQIELNHHGIVKVEFYSLEPFILDDFFFSKAI